MAKKKTTAATKSTPQPTPAARKTMPAKKAAAVPVATLSYEEIGNVAGEVWQVLSNRGEQTPATLKKAIHASGDTVSAAIGWLAREGKLEFITVGRTVKVSLK
jgi:hypothetical protein